MPRARLSCVADADADADAALRVRMSSTDSPAAKSPAERDRKAEHIQLALDDRLQQDGRGFDSWQLEHCALPELDLAEIDLSTEFLGKPLMAPLLISCMTGGTADAARINRNLAIAAERAGVAVGVGSQRKALEDESLQATFQVRDYAPTVPLLANLGAVQLNCGYGLAECQAAVRMIDADALVLHLNPLQEAIQPEGDVNFANLLPKIEAIVGKLEVPVIVKEIGMGISLAVAERLAEAGVRIIDTAGHGGTNWARIEAQRAADLELGATFADWGISTPDSIRAVAKVPGVTVIGSGGIRTGIDVAKAVALGAHMVGLAHPFLGAAMESADAVVARIERALTELRVSMFCAGTRTLADLREVTLIDRAGRP